MRVPALCSPNLLIFRIFRFISNFTPDSLIRTSTVAFKRGCGGGGSGSGYCVCV